MKGSRWRVAPDPRHRGLWCVLNEVGDVDSSQWPHDAACARADELNRVQQVAHLGVSAQAFSHAEQVRNLIARERARWRRQV